MPNKIQHRHTTTPIFSYHFSFLDGKHASLKSIILLKKTSTLSEDLLVLTDFLSTRLSVVVYVLLNRCRKQLSYKAAYTIFSITNLKQIGNHLRSRAPELCDRTRRPNKIKLWPFSYQFSYLAEPLM